MPLRLRFHEIGNPAQVLGCESFAHRIPQSGEVLVRIQAAPINPADLNFIEGNYGVKAALPSTPGIEGCGIVVASQSIDFQIGDAVIFLKQAETWSSHTCVAAEDLFLLPTGIDPQQAAMLKVNPATAWHLLHTHGIPEKNTWIVQNAGTSAVSQCVIQLARHFGVKTISFVRNLDSTARLKALGAEHVFEDSEAGFGQALKLMGGSHAALAFNSVGGESALRLMKLLKDSGTHITFGAMAKRPLSIPNGLLIFKNLHFRGFWLTRWMKQAATDEIRALYTFLAEKVLRGELRQEVDSTFELEAFPQALERLSSTQREGKILFINSSTL